VCPTGPGWSGARAPLCTSSTMTSVGGWVPPGRSYPPRSGPHRASHEWHSGPVRDFLIDLFGLSGRTALVTGASSGIGREIAEGLARAGARVVLAGRDADRLREATEGIQRAGGTVEWAAADLGDRSAVARLAEAVPEPDILV